MKSRVEGLPRTGGKEDGTVETRREKNKDVRSSMQEGCQEGIPETESKDTLGAEVVRKLYVQVSRAEGCEHASRLHEGAPWRGQTRPKAHDWELQNARDKNHTTFERRKVSAVEKLQHRAELGCSAASLEIRRHRDNAFSLPRTSDFNLAFCSQEAGPQEGGHKFESDSHGLR